MGCFSPPARPQALAWIFMKLSSLKTSMLEWLLAKAGWVKEQQMPWRKYGAVYGAFTGGAAVLAAKAVKSC
jgi:tartrate dehydratase beta subunit/fumarate hydratase class I family protein